MFLILRMGTRFLNRDYMVLYSITETIFSLFSFILVNLKIKMVPLRQRENEKVEGKVLLFDARFFTMSVIDVERQ